jgi:nucleoside-diphosphate-sugar epimerase
VARFNPGLKRFVFVSSLAAAGPSRPDRPRVESDVSAPVSDYGASKLAAEEEVLSRKKDFPVTIVRPPAVYGPRDKGVFTFFQAIRTGVLPLLGMDRTDPRRYSFVHVDDLVQGLCLAGFAENDRSGEVYYISGEGEYSWPSAMSLMAAGMQRKTIPVRLPLTVMKGAAAACSAYSFAFGKVLPFSLDKIKEIQAPAWTCASHKAKNELGFRPYWELEKGFQQTAAWYKENGWL